jgi:phosphoglycerate dehydrogenase-like enzyme
VIGAMLAMVTGVDRSIVSQTERRWDDDRGTERLAGKRFLAVGPGPIGRASSRRARDLGMSVAAVGRSSPPLSAAGSAAPRSTSSRRSPSRRRRRCGRSRR